MSASLPELAAIIAGMQHEIRQLKERITQLESAAGGVSNGQLGDLRCSGIHVMDELGAIRIAATTAPDGSAGISWRDRERRLRMTIETYADGGAGMAFRDIERRKRVVAGTLGDGTVALPTRDLKMGSDATRPAPDAMG